MKTRRTQTIFVIAALVILIIVATGVLIYNARPPKPHPQNDPNLAGNTGGNLYNGGLFCESGGFVYFANSFDGGNIYVMKPDETEMKKLGNFNAFSINVGGDYIYFLQGAPGAGAFRVNPGIYRCKTDGKEVFFLRNKAVHSMTLCGNELLYQNHDVDNMALYKRLFAINTSGENNRQLSTEIINPSCYVNGDIYYSRTETDHYIYTLDLASNFSFLVLEGNTYNALYDDGYVYYMDMNNNYRLCRYSLAGGYSETLTGDRVECYNIINGVVFFQNLAPNPNESGLFRMNTDGSDLVMVRLGTHTKINLTSQAAYFQVYGDETHTYRAELFGNPNAGLFTTAQNIIP